MSAEVEGISSVADLKNGLIASHGGYWADGWCQLSLRQYV
jgi:hypothetical protein